LRGFRSVLEEKIAIKGPLTGIAVLGAEAQPAMAVMEINKLIDIIGETAIFNDHSGNRQFMETVFVMADPDLVETIIVLDSFLDLVVEFEAIPIDAVEVCFGADHFVEVNGMITVAH
jgi:hypothetical protein